MDNKFDDFNGNENQNTNHNVDVNANNNLNETNYASYDLRNNYNEVNNTNAYSKDVSNETYNANSDFNSYQKNEANGYVITNEESYLNQYNQHKEYRNPNGENQTYSYYQANPNVNNNLNSSYQPNYYNNQGMNNNTYYSSNGTQGQDEKKQKKKGKFGPIKLVASAIAFGVVVGGAYQGYSYLAQLKAELNQKVEEKFEINKAEDTEIDDTTVISVDSEIKGVVTDVSNVVENVMPSIVAINSSSTVTSYDFFGREFNEPVEGSGSGIIIGQNSSELLIVTNNHVIEGAQKVEIVFADESTATATVKGAEARVDLAVVSVKLEDLSK